MKNNKYIYQDNFCGKIVLGENTFNINLISVNIFKNIINCYVTENKHSKDHFDEKKLKVFPFLT